MSLTKCNQLYSIAREAKSVTGKSIFQQFIETSLLRIRRNPVGISEYYEYGIFNPDLSPTERREFIGWRDSAELDKCLNKQQSRILANDKLINYLILQTHGFPIPKPIATYTKDGRTIGNELSLKCKDDVVKFLKGNVFPFYTKPICAGYGRGVLGVSGWDENGSKLKLLDGTSITIDQFLSDFDYPQYHGKLFQKSLQAHPLIAEVTGTTAISCVRLICFMTSDGPVIHTAFWKITSGSNMVDNFTHGDYGNCLASIDLKTGTVTHAIAKMGIGGEISQHPVSGKQIIGFSLPDWNRTLDLVKSASKHFPGLRLQNWDVAMCTDGPTIIELNTESELAIPQAINKRGLMDKRLVRLLKTEEKSKQHAF